MALKTETYSMIAKLNHRFGQDNVEGSTMKPIIEQRTIGFVKGTNGCITQDGKPFYRLRLDAAVLDDLLPMLDQAARTDQRPWHMLTATAEQPSRLRLYRIPTPDFEQHAAKSYVRGTIYRISGRESINISFSVHGALLIADRLREALQHMGNFVLLMVPCRKIDLIEFLPDVELERAASDEHARLGEAGLSIAAQVLGREDFRDWEAET